MRRSVGRFGAGFLLLSLVLGTGVGVGFEALTAGPAGAATVFTVNDTSDLGLATVGGTTCVSTAGPDDCTLRSAIEASSNLGTGTAVDIVLASATYTIASAYNGSAPDPQATGAFKIGGDVTITGTGQALTFVNGADLDRVFIVEPGATAVISDLTIENGETVAADEGGEAAGGLFTDGGGIGNAGTLTLTDDTVTASTAADNGYGGGVADGNEGTGPTTLTGTTVEDNTATRSGGGIMDQSGSTADGMTINGGSDITENDADLNGGGIIAYGQSGVTLTITNSDVNSNHADGSGGGIGVEDGESLDITGSDIDSNVAYLSDYEAYGGGIWLLIGGTDTYTDDLISGNGAANGGGVADESGSQTFTDSTISDNDAVVGGGGFLVDNASVDLTINQSLVYDNEAVGSESNGLLTPGAGGAFYVHACATLHLTNDTLYENTAAANDGGGMFSNNCESSGGSVTFVNDTIDSNLGTGNGENLNLTFDLAVTLTNSIVAGGDGANCALNDFTSGGYNLEDDSTCSPNGTTDITGQSPDLGGLSDNGGSSDTLLPNAGSPAIGAIPSASCTVTVDQHEYNRHAGASGSCTIGAVEYGASSGGGSTVTPTTIYVNTATGSDSNDCLTPSAGAEPYNGPCQTIAHAVALLTNSDATYGTSPTETVDYTSVTTISVAAGTYDESPISIDLPDRTLTIEGPAYTQAVTPPPSCSPTKPPIRCSWSARIPTAPPSPSRTSGSKRRRAPAPSPHSAVASTTQTVR